MYAQLVEDFLSQHFKKTPEIHSLILDAVRYSLLQKAAKRFRAGLACLTAEALGGQTQKVIAFAAALECVHTYSLIHDDLPCVDDDDFRRGEASNHKVFGEATALLAGDALLTEAFSIIAEKYSSKPELGLKLVSTLSRAAGMHGMISGQIRDLESHEKKLSEFDELRLLNQQKTGALIMASIEGAGLACGASVQQASDLLQFGLSLGLAFQVKDDLLDHPEDKGTSYTSFMGEKEAQLYLNQLTEKCLEHLSGWDQKAESLREMVRFNLARKN